MRPHRLWVAASVTALVIGAVATPALAFTQRQTAEPRALPSSAVEKSKTVTRKDLHGGSETVVDSRKVTVNVDTTGGLRDRQGIKVTWRGAHPTGGVVPDPNSATAATQQEYPVVLLQCRGVDSKKAAPAKRLSPETCWTQTPFERFANDFNTTLPPWRMDQYAKKSDRERYVNTPKNRPSNCGGRASAERWLDFVNVKGKSFRGGPNACAGAPPEASASALGGLNLPSNTTYASTGVDGRGEAKFNVRSSDSNASLGCSSQVDCSLVVIPIMGISCDLDGAGLPGKPPSESSLASAVNECTAKGSYSPGQNFNSSIPGKATDSGSYWWSESNWRNRITIPLHFARSASVCDITQGGGDLIYGSELMIQATESWTPPFCLDRSKTPVQHVQTGEPQARNLLSTGNIPAALGSEAPATPYPVTTVDAPVAVTGFAVTFSLDDAEGRPIAHLKLDPRLLAKLLTMSYPVTPDIKAGHPGFENNPLNISDDPEFIALNPSIRQGVNTAAAGTILSLSSDSDVINALTSYVNADPEARAWLDGKPDPWGMKVNPAYEGIDLPVHGWPILDDYIPDYPQGLNDCLYLNPVPYLPLVASPLNRLSYISLAMQFSLANSQVSCYLPSPEPGNTDGAKLVALGRQTPGFRFMLGITSIPDARRFKIDTATLQTSVASSAKGAFHSAKGRTFIGPTDEGMRTAAAMLTRSSDSDIWNFPYSKVVGIAPSAARTAQAPDQAYPGTMVVYASVPTVPTDSMTKEAAPVYADWIRYVATKGQRPGTDLGELPDGYLPMTEANGLIGLRNYALKAADALDAQKGHQPKPPTTPSGHHPPTTSPAETTGSDPTSQDGPGGKTTDPPQALADQEPAALTTALDAGMAKFLLPLLLLVPLAAGAIAGITLWRGRRRPTE